ncbi:tetratricopeptide repeat protein [Myxococcaceae bacterium GXIMD 01537]
MKAATRKLLDASRAHLQQGEVGLAVHVLKQAIELEPDERQLWEEMFSLCMLAGSARSAVVAAFELRRIDPVSANYAYMHGVATLAAGQVQEAVTILEDARRRAPRAAEARRALAQAYDLLQQPERVRALLEEVVAEHPEDADAVNDYAVFLMKAGEEGKRRAAPLLERVLAAHPDNLDAHLNLALALADSDPDAARPHARRALDSREPAVREQAQRLFKLLGGD